MNKMIINHLQKLFVTKDASTILNELEIEHPAAKMLILAAKMQSQEVGDGTNAVIMLAAALLEHAAELLKMVQKWIRYDRNGHVTVSLCIDAQGLNPVEIAEGYEMA